MVQSGAVYEGKYLLGTAIARPVIGKKLVEIAEKVGYNNARHFSDMFKKMYGKLPNDYRQELKKSSE